MHVPQSLPGDRLTRDVSRAGFTLIELLTVVGLIVLFVGVLGYAFLRGGTSSVGMQGAQTTISGLVTLVRAQAATSGRNARLYVNANSANTERYLRYVVPVARNAADTAWVPLTDGIYLPPGVYVVPYVTPSGSQIETGASWTNLNSSVLFNSESAAIMSTTAEAWMYLEFTPRGTTSTSGNIVLAHGRTNAPASSPPFVFVTPENVRGVAISVYGLTRLMNDATAFAP